MPIYHKLGRLPAKRHVAFRKDDGSLYYEHLMGNRGFTGLQSLLYTLRRPTTVKAIEPAWVSPREAEPDSSLRLRHLRTHRLPAPGGSAVRDRQLLVFNDDVALSLALRGPDDTTVPLYIFSAVQRRVTPSIHAIGSVIVFVGVVAFAGAALANRAITHGRAR